MEIPEQANQNTSVPPENSDDQRAKGWFESNKGILFTVIIGPCVVAIAGIIAKDREQARMKEIELAKIEKEAEVKREQIRQQQAYELWIRQQDLQRLDQQQNATQRQRILTFYSAVLSKLEQAEGVWWKRPTQQSDAALVQFDRTQLLPIYAEAQKLIAENMELTSLNPSMREKMSEFGRNVATYDYNRYVVSIPHGNLRYSLQWAVQALSQRP